ncbi:hypothetical protein GCM10011320_48680 [Neoroseomonas lacus]|uniref:Uncharacterized protein n=1 Tax=Neoroseomonas lacus TaxID=287609 RepID=A0A917NW70_9PROT|nr:hypothetical protein GCM10011320_48680 [Neoroseomonas lacus]
MAIMSARVHMASMTRGVGQAGILEDRQGVHVGTESDEGAIGRSTHDAAVADADLHHVTAELAEAFSDELSRLLEFEAEFRCRVEPLPPKGHFGVSTRDLRQNRHGCDRPDPTDATRNGSRVMAKRRSVILLRRVAWSHVY